MPKKDTAQSVTNAILDQKLQTLTETVGKLTTTVEKGFEGIHARQDTTNGKVLKAGQDIITNRSETETKFADLVATFKYNRIIWYMLTTCVSMIVALASYILFKN
jgi:hypothetical protein